MESSEPFGRNAKIREEPVGILGRGLRQLLNDGGQLRWRETIEKKMRDEQIVVALGRTPRREVVLQEPHALHAVGQFTLKALSRQLQHSLARVDAIDLNSRMPPQQFAKKSSIPLACDERTSRGHDIAQARDTATLEIIAERDPLQRPIPGGDRVEAHAFVATNASSGVRRTRSAMAVR